MKYKIVIEVYETEPRFFLRHPATKQKQTAAGNPKAVGRALIKLLERVGDSDPQGDKAQGAESFSTTEIINELASRGVEPYASFKQRESEPPTDDAA